MNRQSQQKRQRTAEGKKRKQQFVAESLSYLKANWEQESEPLIAASSAAFAGNQSPSAAPAEIMLSNAAQSSGLEAALAELAATKARLQQVESQMHKLAQREALLKRRLSSQIRDSLDFGTSLKTAVNEIRHLLQIDRCKFFWYRHDIEPHTFELILEASDPRHCQGANQDPTKAIATVGKLMLEPKLLQLDDISTDPQISALQREQLEALGLRSFLAVAMQTHSGETGVIACEHSSSIRYWNKDEVELLQDVSQQLAIAINQAKLYQQTRFSAAAANAQAEQLKKALQELKQTQTQLIQTEKMSGLGQLVAGVAHEINNPVNFISGNLDYTEKYIRDLLELIRLYQQSYPQPTAEIKKYADSIELDFLCEDLPKMLCSMKMGADRICQIVMSLRNFSRHDEAEMKPVDIHEGIDSTLLILQNRLKARGNHPGIPIIKEYGQLPPVDCYAGQLNQVFMNLLGNAIDALDQAVAENKSKSFAPQITIRTQVYRPDRIAICIADNGLGMTEEVKKRLFDPFFTTKPVGKGTGLGLSISYQIVVEKHGGSLRCASTPGQGAEFWIEIPLRQQCKSDLSVSQAA